MTIARKFTVGLVAVLIASLAWAQEAVPEDDVLQRYELATESLAAAADALPGDPVDARAALDRAFSALLTLSRGDTSTLSDSLDRVFERARTAIDNRSATDLAVQTAVLRGGFQRLLFESALTAAVEGRPDLARSRLLRLAQDLQLGDARLAQLEDLTDAGPFRRVFEAGVAEQVSARLQALADAGVPEDRDAAYRTLSRAYADYLLVQDSGRIDPGTNRRFVEAAEALVDGQDEAYLAALTTLATSLGDLREAADAGAPPRADAEMPSEGVSELPSDDVNQAVQEGADEAATPSDDATAPETPVEEAAETAPAEDAAAEDAAAEDAPASEAPADAASTDETTTADAETTTVDGVDLAALRSEIAAQLDEEREAQALASLEDELAILGIPSPARTMLASDLYAADVATVQALETELAADAALVQAWILRGDTQSARDQLAQLEARYEAGLRKVAVRVAPLADAELRELIDRMNRAPAIRNADTSLLTSEVLSLSQSLRGRTAPWTHRLAASASELWAGLSRPIVMIVLALLALLPLRLLGLAFGGGNPNWRRVSTALLLLVVPILVEGVIAVAALLADPLGVPALAGWTVASIFSSDLTQLLWALVMLLALVLASSGFYGICVQFGVLGRRGRNEPTTDVKTRDDTLVDWNDDF
ncbi:MAG: hypothetical protein U5J97_09610 [Trueperaceae bacterium]|nr:hypothetical protein [Trueperaceae bacterium]